MLEEKKRPASVSRGEWCGNSTRIGLVVDSQNHIDFEHAFLPLRDSARLLKSCRPRPSTPARTIQTYPDFCSATKKTFHKHTCARDAKTRLVLFELGTKKKLAENSCHMVYNNLAQTNRLVFSGKFRKGLGMQWGKNKALYSPVSPRRSSSRSCRARWTRLGRGLCALFCRQARCSLCRGAVQCRNPSPAVYYRCWCLRGSLDPSPA